MTLWWVSYFIWITSLMLFARWGYNRGIERGYALGRDHRPALKAREIKCLCDHGPNFHNKKKGNRCEQIVQHKTWDRRGKAYFVSETCACLCYTGPEFLPEYVSPVELELTR